MLLWVLIIGQAIVVATCLLAINSFGKWTRQLREVNHSNREILRAINEPNDTAMNHVATFVASDDDTNQRSA